MFIVPLLIVHLVSPHGLGYGDVKCGVGLGAAAGLIDAWSSTVALAVASTMAVLDAVIARRRRLAFGPGLVLGTEVAITLAVRRGTSPVA